MFDFYVGIDIASELNYACIMSKNYDIIVKPFSFTNDITGFEILKLYASNYDNILFVMESTGNYHSNLFAYLNSFNYNVNLANPGVIKAYRKTTGSDNKDDAIDAQLIAKAAIIEKFEATYVDPAELEELCSLTRFYTKSTRHKAQYKTELSTFLTLVFPEYIGYFSSLDCNTSLQVLLKYPTADKLSRAHVATLAALLSKYSRGKHKEDSAKKLITLAKNSCACRKGEGYESIVIACVNNN